MAALTRDELLRLARAGAGARVRELQAELDTIFRTFPDLRPGGAKRTAAAPGTRKAKGAAGSTATAAARREWNAAQRDAVSERMKKDRAARRAKAAKAAK